MTPSTPWCVKLVALRRHRRRRHCADQFAPGVRELRDLDKALAAAQLAGRWRNVDPASRGAIQALSAPRLHRSP